eukprot:TRINITY_DN9746_c0_g1_i2.p1 TRINITY_DN9746_c0_g1~~TRINITY_DN9746_c0_g1_i2.p1  ORF type:complete len:364 (+),score=92.24 TRINITY_DN9746_c0_g1_i2:134-1225(+)
MENYCLNKENGCIFRYKTGIEIGKHLTNDCLFFCCENKDYGCSFLGTQEEVQIHLTNCSFSINNNNNNDNNRQQLDKIERIVDGIFNEVCKPPLPPRNEEVEKLEIIESKLITIEQQNKGLQKEVNEIKQQNQTLEIKFNQIISLLQNISSNQTTKLEINNNNDNNNGNKQKASKKILISSSNNWVWNSSNCGSNLQMITSTKLKKINIKGDTNAHVTGTHKFNSNTGIFNWKLKLDCLKTRYWICFGVARLSDLDFNNNNVHKCTYGWSTFGQLMKNDGTMGFANNKKIKSKTSSMIVYLQLNTDDGQLKTRTFDDNESITYLSHTHPSKIPFPCYRFVLLNRKDNEVELLGVNQQEYSSKF